VQVVVIPIFRSEGDRSAVADAIERFELALRSTPEGREVRLEVDWREESPGFKYNHWELRGVPFRIEVGPRDVAAGQGTLVRRVDRSKEAVPLDRLAAELPLRLSGYQQELFQRALDFREANTHHVDDYEAFKRVNEEQGGFIWAHWCGSAECEAQVNQETGATIRNIPFDAPPDSGACILDGRPSDRRVVFARAY
jgi:prolyl-tRNA synthetase